MKTPLIAAAAALGITGLALADEARGPEAEGPDAKGPRLMNDVEMSRIVAGTELEVKIDDVLIVGSSNPMTQFGKICVTVTTGEGVSLDGGNCP